MRERNMAGKATVTYFHHSGFSVAVDDTLMIFDYWRGENREINERNALTEKDMYVEILAERIGLTPATVSFHLKKLQAAGLVEQRREQYYMMYSLRKNLLNITLSSLISEKEANASQEEIREIQYRQKVLKAFMPYGVCEILPAQIKKRMIIYEEIIKRFDEKYINETISAVHADYCTVRRALIGLGWMTRAGTAYTVNDYTKKKE